MIKKGLAILTMIGIALGVNFAMPKTPGTFGTRTSNNFGGTITADFPTSLNSWNDGDVIEDEDIEAIQAYLGIQGSAVSSSITYKLTNASSSDPGHTHSTSSISGVWGLTQGGTGSTTAAGARTNLGLGSSDSPTFTGLTLSGLSPGSLVVASTSGVLAQNNSRLFWDFTNSFLGIGTNAPSTTLHVVGGLTAGNSSLGVNFGDATSTEITNNTAPTLDTDGEIAIDTNDQRLLFRASSTNTIIPRNVSKCANIGDLISTDDNILLWVAPANITVVNSTCKTSGFSGTQPTLSFEDDAGNAFTGAPTCNASTTSDFTSFTAGNTLIKGEGMRFDTTNTPSPTSATQTLICFNYTIDE